MIARVTIERAYRTTDGLEIDIAAKFISAEAETTDIAKAIEGLDEMMKGIDPEIKELTLEETKDYFADEDED